MRAMETGVIVNPVAGSGRMVTAWPRIERALRARFDTLTIERTDAPGEVSGLARKLAMEGCRLVIAVGGDGTISEAVDGLLKARASGSGDCHLGIVPVGTGSDLARGLGIDGDIDRIAARVAEGEGRLLDAGRVDFVDDHGALASRHFVNIASLGVSGPTDRAVNGVTRKGRLSGKAIFFWHTVRELIRYRFQQVRVTVDGGEPIEAQIALVAVANSRFFGGGMMIAPDALADDGQFEVVIVTARSKLSLLVDLRLVYSGSHRALASCRFLRGKSVTVEPLGDPLENGALLDIDGESPGRIPATFQVLPGAITVRC